MQGELADLCRNDKVIDAFKKKVDEHALKNKLHRAEMPGAIHLCEEAS